LNFRNEVKNKRHGTQFKEVSSRLSRKKGTPGILTVGPKDRPVGQGSVRKTSRHPAAETEQTWFSDRQAPAGSRQGRPGDEGTTSWQAELVSAIGEGGGWERVVGGVGDGGVRGMMGTLVLGLRGGAIYSVGGVLRGGGGFRWGGLLLDHF